MKTKAPALLFVALTLVMVLELVVTAASGHEPYPAVLHPAFARIPGIGGKGSFAVPHIIGVTSDGKETTVSLEKVFTNLPPHLRGRVFGTLKERSAARRREPKTIRIGIIRAEVTVDRFLTEESAFREFKDWIGNRLSDSLGKRAPAKIRLINSLYSYRLTGTSIEVSDPVHETILTITYP